LSQPVIGEDPSANMKPDGFAASQRRVPRWIASAGAAALVLLIAAVAVADYVVHNAEPILRRRVIANLENRFHSPVELDALHISVLQGLQVSGNGLRILYLAGPSQPDVQPRAAAPMLSVKSFAFRAGIRDLLKPTMRVTTVYVQGMQISIPPRQDRGPLLPKDDPNRRGQPRVAILVDEIVCRDVTLTIETNKPGKQPLVFPIRDVTLHDVGAKKPFTFEAWLLNPKPVGDIHSTGHFGPWQDDNPRDSPVDGDYAFTNANLGTIKGIGGMLSSTGKYSGTLGEIGVVGTTDTPDFSLDVGEHAVDLKTEFDATVDGTTGDTKLNSVHATLLHTVLQVSGNVIRSSDAGVKAEGAMPGDNPGDVPGHFIEVSVVSNQARVEDILTLAAKSSPPLMQGSLKLRAHISIPPGKVSVSRKMRVQGTFAIGGETFSNPAWQETVDKLSQKAVGDAELAKIQNAKRVTSAMSGSFVLANGLVDVPKLNYKLPGAQVDLAGKYSLDGDTFDFDGTVRTQATASQMLTGWKSIVAMPFDKLLKKDGAGLEVPITISGTKSAPKMGLDLGKLGAQIFHRGRKPDDQLGNQPPDKQP